MPGPLAYFITFTCYGTWLHGDDRGSAGRTAGNVPGEPYLPADPELREFERSELTHPAYRLDEARRELVLASVREVCVHRGWLLHAAHVRSNHAHIVVTADAPPERVMNAFKAYASRRLNQAGRDPSGVVRWTRHGSTVYLWHEDRFTAAVTYVVEGQGEPMAVYRDPG